MECALEEMQMLRGRVFFYYFTCVERIFAGYGSMKKAQDFIIKIISHDSIFKEKLK